MLLLLLCETAKRTYLYNVTGPPQRGMIDNDELANKCYYAKQQKEPIYCRTVYTEKAVLGYFLIQRKKSSERGGTYYMFMIFKNMLLLDMIYFLF